MHERIEVRRCTIAVEQAPRSVVAATRGPGIDRAPSRAEPSGADPVDARVTTHDPVINDDPHLNTSHTTTMPTLPWVEPTIDPSIPSTSATTERSPPADKASIASLWTAYRTSNPALPPTPAPAWHFCDNRADAAECLALVLAGKKRATASSAVFYAVNAEPVPKAGDHSVITDFDGLAKCIIRTDKVTHLRMDEVTTEMAATEGEGDGSLEYWRAVHWAYYARELAGTRVSVSRELEVVFEEFEVVWPKPSP